MRIVIPHIGLHHHGGTRILIQLANTLASRGHDVEFLLPKGRNSGHYHIDEKIEISEVSFNTGIKGLDYFAFFACVAPKIRGDLAIASFFPTWFPIQAARFLSGVDFVYFVQGIESIYPGIKGSVLNLMCDFTYKSANILSSNSVLTGLIEKKGGQASQTIEIGPAPTFYETPKSANVRKDFEIVAFARPETWKRPDRLEMLARHLIETYPEENRPRVVCVSQSEEMLTRFAAFGWHGVRPRDECDLIATIDRAMVHVFTSEREGFGLPPLECMSRGLPSVLYDSGGPMAYVQNEINALVVSQTDDKAFLTAIDRILADESLRRRMSAASIETAAKFDMRVTLHQACEFIEKLATQRDLAA